MLDSLLDRVRNYLRTCVDPEQRLLRPAALVRAVASDPEVVAAVGGDCDLIDLRNRIAAEAVQAFDRNEGGIASSLEACVAGVEEAVFPDGREECMRRHFALLLISALDIVAFQVTGPRQVTMEAVEVHGEDHLHDALNGRRGVMLVSVYQAHPGFIKAVSSLAGQTIGAVRRQAADGTGSILLRGNSDTLAEIPAAAGGVRQMLSLLRGGGVVGAYKDYVYPETAPCVAALFGRHVLMSRAMVRLAIQTRAAVVPASIVREWPVEQNRVTVQFFSPMSFESRSDSTEADVAAVGVQLGVAAECLIRLHPPHWQLWGALGQRWEQAKNWLATHKGAATAG